MKHNNLLFISVWRYAEEEIHELKPFSIKGALDCIPRTTYALVAFHIRTDAEYMNDGDPTALITLIHIPDRYCNAPATTLCQYLKCNDGRVLNLKVQSVKKLRRLILIIICINLSSCIHKL
jgi:hypothetical protein